MFESHQVFHVCQVQTPKPPNKPAKRKWRINSRVDPIIVCAVFLRFAAVLGSLQATGEQILCYSNFWAGKRIEQGVRGPELRVARGGLLGESPNKLPK